MQSGTFTLILTMVFGFGGTAQAKLLICNETPVTQSISIAYKADGVFKSEGWWNVDAAACKTVISGALTGRYYYYRATAKDREFRGEKYFFCTSPSAYTIVGSKDCVDRGYDRSEFREIDTGKKAKEFELTLVEQKASSVAAEKPAEFKSGSLGEPFSVYAVFQECDAIEGAQYCAFHAEGWKWYAWFNGGTSDRVLNIMQKLLPGDLLDVSGDLISYGDITTEVAVAQVTQHDPSDALENTTVGIQGKWRSSDDPQSRMEIVGGEIHDYYGAEFMETSFFRVANQCDGNNGVGPVLIKRTPDAQSSDCYIIMGWDAEVLQLSYIGGAGSGDLTYEKEH